MRKSWIYVVMVVLLGCSTDNILSTEAQLKKDVAIIDKYLEKNNIVAIRDTSGLRLVLHDAGSGLLPSILSTLTVRYKGMYMNGTVFDESDLNSAGLVQPLNSPLSGLIEGWRIAFTKYIAKGGKATLYVPSSLGYGRNDSGGVPPNTNLIFEVELVKFTNSN